MIITLFEDNLEPHDVAHLTPNIGVRAVVKHQDKYILIHIQSNDMFTLPGGGVEPDERLEEALKREILEETGYAVTNIKKTLELQEHYYDSVWHHHFYRCDTIGTPQSLTLTLEEIEQNIRLVFMTFDEVMHTFDEHIAKHPHWRNIQKREFLGFIHSV